MDAVQICHIGTCVWDMDEALVMYRDTLGTRVVDHVDTDPPEVGWPHNYQYPRRTRRRLGLSFSTTTNQTLALTNRTGEEPDGQAIQLNQVYLKYELTSSWEVFTNSQRQVPRLCI